MRSGLFFAPLWFRLSVATLLTLAAFTAPAQTPAPPAAAPTWPLVGPAFSAPPEDLRKAAAAVPAEKYMPATILYERDAYTLQPDGRITLRHSMVYRIETEAAVRGWGETSIRWEAWYQNQPEIHARVFTPDGKVSELDQKTITDGPASAQDEGTYSDGRIRKAPLPGLTVGAIVEEEAYVEDKAPFFSGGGIYRRFFNRSVPITRSQLLIDVPKGLHFDYRVKLLPQLAVSSTEENGIRHLVFDQAAQPAYVNNDVNLATHIRLRPLVEFSTGESWAAVARTYSQLAEPQILPASVQFMLPANLVSQGPGRLATIQAIVTRLHADVRYTGIEFGEAALQPQTAAEVLKRHYGDCKDKAAFLVALLRAAGIEAHMVLLNPGYGPDVTPELPGMNQFDHAITYVPADKKGGTELWIDATAEYAQVGTLPAADRDRLALIVADNTTSLTRTPVGTPEDDAITETRDVRMAPNGPAEFTESSDTRGDIDETYRSSYGGQETKESRNELDRYIKSVYLAKTLASVEHGDGRDFTKPFFLHLKITEAKRAKTDIDDGAVAIPFYWVWGRLPEWFRHDPAPAGQKLTPQQEEDRKKAEAARTTEYQVHPFLTEWRYNIYPPEGFEPRTLPENKTVPMGPATYSQHFETGSDGVVHATLRFNSGPGTYTLAQALALRDAVLAAYKQDMVMVLFDQVGARLLAAGKTREALAADSDLIAHHPDEALHHTQMAYTLLQAGVGDRARAEAEKATKLDPKSAVAWRILGWVCEFNQIGVRYAQGFDWQCAHDAFVKSKDLDPEENVTRINLAIIEEYNKKGERYGDGAPLKDAVAEYRALTEKDKEVGEEYQDNLLFDLLYGGQYQVLLDELAKLSSSKSRDGMAVAATVALHGVKAGIARAEHLSGGSEGRIAALASAGAQLLQMHLYGPGTEIMAAGVEGQSDSAQATQQIELFKNLTRWKGEYLPATNPASAAQRMMIAFFSGEVTEANAAQFIARHAYASDEAWKRNIEKASQGIGLVHSLAGQMDLTDSVVLDLLAGSMKFTSEGDDKIGYRVSMESLGSQTQQIFVSRDEGGFKVVSDGSTSSEVGNYALYLLSKGRDAEAKSLLDWQRDQLHRGGGDDPLAGPELPRFWTSGETSGLDAMEIAAASLIDDTPEIKPLLPKLKAAFDKATSDDDRINLALVLTNGYAAVQDGPQARAAAAVLLKKYPSSHVALGDAGTADALLKDWNDWNALLDEQLKKHPKDEILLRLKGLEAEYEGNFARAREFDQKVFDTGKATEGDYNNYAWESLFDNHVDDKAVEAAQKSNMLSKGESYAVLHTLACIYAAQGKTREAHELLLKAMNANSLPLPDSSIWFGLGAIYEQYGLPDAAIQAFLHVEKPPGIINPGDTWVLAQMHLKALTASAR